MTDNIASQNGEDKFDRGSKELPGERLRLAREGCGLSRAEVATHLKLSVEKIASLEQGDVTHLAAPVYVAGYLRAYAKLVGLPGDEVVAEFDALSEMSAPSVDPATSPAANNYGQVEAGVLGKGARLGGKHWSPRAVVVSLIIVVAIVAYLVITDEESRNESRAIINSQLQQIEEQPDIDSGTDARTNEAVSSDEGSASGILQGAVDSVEGNSDRKSANALINEEDSKIKVEEGPAENMPVDTLLSVDKEKELNQLDQKIPEQKQDSGNLNHSVLVINFSEDSWIDVKDASGNSLLYQLGKSGTSKTVWGIAPFRIQLGYAPGVDIRFNGEEYDLSRFANRRSVRFTVGESEINPGTN